MRIVFADKNKRFLQFVEQLFRHVRVGGSPTGIVPVTVNASASTVYNALSPWMHACIIDWSSTPSHAGSPRSSHFTSTRSFSPTHHRNQPITKVRVQPPSFEEEEEGGAGSDAPNATDDEFDAALYTSYGGDGGRHAKKDRAYYIMRAALVAVAGVRRDNALDIVVVPCLGAVTPATALAMVAATTDFYKLQSAP